MPQKGGIRRPPPNPKRRPHRKTGRPRGGRRTWTTELLQAAVSRATDLDEMVEILLGMARGKERTVMTPKGELVTIADPPNFKAAEYLVDRMLGKMAQPIKGETGGPPVRVVFDNRLGVKATYDDK